MQPGSGISEGRAEYKAGKLIKVRARFEDDTIRDIRITGDFFLYPEEKIEDIERVLRDRRLDEVEDILAKVFSDVEYEGISPEALAKVIREAWKRRS